MPQGKRKVPFSGKAKREQLKNKKHGKKAIFTQNSDDESEKPKVKNINQQSQKNSKSKTNRYALKFYSDSPEEIHANKLLSRVEIKPTDEILLEISLENYFPDDLSFPKRPEWSYVMNKQDLEIREQRYFTHYLDELEKREDWKKLSYFELNLETWRQLWRVLEISDIILFIVDIRFAGLMFPPSLYEYVTGVLKKDIILVLNKIDLAPASLVLAWKLYFQEKFPSIHIVLFTSLPSYNLRGTQREKAGLKIRRRKGRVRMTAEGAQSLFEACEKIVKSELDLTSWKQKILDEMQVEHDDTSSEIEIGDIFVVDKVDTTFYRHERFQNGVLTIGCLGQPNVGKSSLMNALMGRKVVSVSKTPGHTKHFQTIFLTKNVRLCDCPGLVFPGQVPKPIQVLMGSYPIAQLRDPYTTIRYLAERLNLVELLKLQHPTNDDSWSAVDLCDGWAKKRGFLTARTARFDTYRAANHLLRMTLDGKICLCLYPPNYIKQRDELQKHPELKLVEWVQAMNAQEPENFACSSKFEMSDFSDDDEQLNVAKSKSTESNQIDDKTDSEEEEAEITDEEDNFAPIMASKLNKFLLLSEDE